QPAPAPAAAPMAAADPVPAQPAPAQPAPATSPAPATAPQTNVAAATTTPPISTIPQSTIPAPSSQPSAATPPSSPVAATTSQPTPAEKTLGLRWMPADTEIVMHVKVAELWKSPLLTNLFATFGVNQQLDLLKQQTGLAPSDVETISVGISGL